MCMYNIQAKARETTDVRKTMLGSSTEVVTSPTLSFVQSSTTSHSSNTLHQSDNAGTEEQSSVGICKVESEDDIEMSMRRNIKNQCGARISKCR